MKLFLLWTGLLFRKIFIGNSPQYFFDHVLRGRCQGTADWSEVLLYVKKGVHLMAKPIKKKKHQEEESKDDLGDEDDDSDAEDDWN